VGERIIAHASDPPSPALAELMIAVRDREGGARHDAEVAR
jgi:hypothetical protein